MTYEQGYQYVLGHIIPPEATPIISKYLIDNHIFLKRVSGGRSYWGRFIRKGVITESGNQFSTVIELASDLRPSAALMTLLHEIAHHRVYVLYERHGKYVRPHGKEWQHEYCQALAGCIQYFPKQIRGDLGYLIRHYTNKNENRITDYLQTWDRAQVLAKRALEKWQEEHVKNIEESVI